MSGTQREADKHHGDLRHRSGLPMSVCLACSVLLCKLTERADLDLCPAF